MTPDPLHRAAVAELAQLDQELAEQRERGKNISALLARAVKAVREYCQSLTEMCLDEVPLEVLIDVLERHGCDSDPAYRRVRSIIRGMRRSC